MINTKGNDDEDDLFRQLTFHSTHKIFDKSHTVSVSDNCVIGKDCKIGIDTVLERSTLGSNCKIGKNV